MLFENFRVLKLPILLQLPLHVFQEPRAGRRSALSSSITYHRNPPKYASPPNTHTLTSTTQVTFKNTKLTFRGKGVIG